MKENRKKKRTVAEKSIRGIAIVGLFLIIGTCLASGAQMFSRNLKTYEDFAFSYARQAASAISGDKIHQYMETGKRDADYEEIERYISSTAAYADIRYFYVVVPQEEDLIYIWDAVSIHYKEGDHAEPPAKLLEHDEYSKGEKEAMQKLMNGEMSEKLLIDLGSYNKEALVSALWPIWDSEGDVAAIVGVDISIVDLLKSMLRLYVNVFLAIALVLAIGMAVFYRVLKSQMISPIMSLKKATGEILDNLDKPGVIETGIHTGDEIEELAHSVEEMDRRLKEYIRENETITAERERITAELDLAGKIQSSMLPYTFPPFPDCESFDIFASMKPAKEVGGDFYDFFLIDDTHLGLVMADVSGKGIPAALFMMVTKIMLQNDVLTGNSPRQSLKNINRLINKDNRLEMFVTVWLGILDLKTGIMTAANAGHEYPVIKYPDGQAELYKDKHGFVLGIIPGADYKEYELCMEPGTSLFVYTDGLTEAVNGSNTLFGTDRMLDAVNAAEGSPEDIIEAVSSAVTAFEGDAPQSDDLTMMCIRYDGPGKG